MELSLFMFGRIPPQDLQFPVDDRALSETGLDGSNNWRPFKVGHYNVRVVVGSPNNVDVFRLNLLQCIWLSPLYIHTITFQPFYFDLIHTFN